MTEYSLADLTQSGVYQIVNTTNGKRYVGSAVRIEKRWEEHRRDLRKEKHHSVSLQRAWRKYGAPAFEFSVLEFCDKASLILVEQRHIDERAEYNICRVAGSSLGIKHSAEVLARMKAAQAKRASMPGYVNPNKGRKYPPEICERMAAPKRGRKRPPRPLEWCLKISEAKKGTRVNIGRVPSEETRRKLSDALRGRRKPLEERKSDPRLSLSDHEVAFILLARVAGRGHSEIAGLVGIKRQLVQRICSRQRYTWVLPELVLPEFRRTGWKVVGRKRGVRKGSEDGQALSLRHAGDQGAR